MNPCLGWGTETRWGMARPSSFAQTRTCIQGPARRRQRDGPRSRGDDPYAQTQTAPERPSGRAAELIDAGKSGDQSESGDAAR